MEHIDDELPEFTIDSNDFKNDIANMNKHKEIMRCMKAKIEEHKSEEFLSILL